MTHRPDGARAWSPGAIVSKILGLVAAVVKWTGLRLATLTRSLARRIRSVAAAARARWNTRRESGEE